MVFILLRRWVLINFVSYLRVDLVSDSLKIVHWDQAEQCVLSGHGLLLSCTSIHSDCTIASLLILLIIWIDHEWGCEISGRKVVIATGGSCLPAGRCHAITGIYLLVTLISDQLLLCLMGSDTLLRHHRIIWVIQMVQLIGCAAVLHGSSCFIINDHFKLLLKVLMRHDIVIAAKWLDYLLAILIDCYGLA